MRRFFAAYALVIIIAIVAAIYSFASYDRGGTKAGPESPYTTGTSWSQGSSSATALTPQQNDVPVVSVGGVDVRVMLADTPQKRTRGLSGSAGLDSDEGMLFIFPKDGIYGFWMKDMHFAIDILWLSSDGTVVHIEENVSPESYPASFDPGKPARYVLELQAGFAKAHNIAAGDVATIRR